MQEPDRIGGWQRLDRTQPPHCQALETYGLWLRTSSMVNCLVVLLGRGALG